VLTRGIPKREHGVAMHADLARLLFAAVLEARRRGAPD
jgi:hypothetical protein